MKELALDFSVPQNKAKRDSIRKAVDAFFMEHKTHPPIRFDTLHELAQQILREQQLPWQDMSFVLLCCGNAVWRDVFASIPFNRRILLLPECLKNAENCKAQNDGFGLLCEGCQACEISDIIDFAEGLGYIVLVSEGTTVTTRLIESGQVDAVIGVGCMSVLEKMFSSVTKYAIPSLAVPLLGDGCKNTQVDQLWLQEELTKHNPNPDLELLNLKLLQDEVKSIFTQENIEKICGENRTITEQIAQKALTEDGQRWRPFLTALTYKALCPDAKNDVYEKLAVSIECFHKASLIHDDIEDNDTERYGKNTLHAEHGVPIALNIGDLLIGKGYSILADSNLHGATLSKCIQAASAGHIALSLGQGEELSRGHMREILPISDMLRIFEHKTSAAFNVSFLLGALAAEASNEILQSLESFSKHLGIAYQIKDDLQDYQGEKGDIRERSFSIVLSILSEQLSENEKVQLQDALNKNEVEKIEKLLESNPPIEKTESLLKEHISLSLETVEKLSELKLKIALHEIVGKIFGDYM